MERLALGSNIHRMNKTFDDESSFFLNIKFLAVKFLVQLSLVRKVFCHVSVKNYVYYEFSAVGIVFPFVSLENIHFWLLHKSKKESSMMVFQNRLVIVQRCKFSFPFYFEEIVYASKVRKPYG